MLVGFLLLHPTQDSTLWVGVGPIQGGPFPFSRPPHIGPLWKHLQGHMQVCALLAS